MTTENPRTVLSGSRPSHVARNVSSLAPVIHERSKPVQQLFLLIRNSQLSVRQEIGDRRTGSRTYCALMLSNRYRCYWSVTSLG